MDEQAVADEDRPELQISGGPYRCTVISAVRTWPYASRCKKVQLALTHIEFVDADGELHREDVCDEHYDEYEEALGGGEVKAVTK